MIEDLIAVVNRNPAKTLDTLINEQTTTLNAPRRAVFTANGTFTVPAGIIYVTAIAAGGNGGSSYSGAGNIRIDVNSAGGGGGAGEYIINRPFKVTVGNSIAITVGAGNTVIGSLITLLKGGNGITGFAAKGGAGSAGGGGGGYNIESPIGGDGGGAYTNATPYELSSTLSGSIALGGIGTNGGIGGYSKSFSVIISAPGIGGGGKGGSAVNNGTTNIYAGGGGGGGIYPFGTGGAGGSTTSTTAPAGQVGGNGVGYGSGGGGGCGANASYLAMTGGTGAPGIVIIEW